MSAGIARLIPEVARTTSIAAKERSNDGRWFAQPSPFRSQQWDLIYFPWNSAAIAMLSLFDLGMPVVVSCRGSQLKIAPHNPARATIREGLEATFRRAAFVHCVSQDILNEVEGLRARPGQSPCHPAGNRYLLLQPEGAGSNVCRETIADHHDRLIDLAQGI